MEQADFKRQYLGEFKVDPIGQYFAELLAEYEDRAEAYDRIVCSGDRDGVAMPANAEESALISHHARNLKAELLARASRQHELTTAQMVVYWRDARKSIVHGG